MNVIKEYCRSSHIAVIRSTFYGSPLDRLVSFYEEAKKDFPNLKLSEVRVVKYGGERYSKTFGIEFPAFYKPNGYSDIAQLEYES